MEEVLMTEEEFTRLQNNQLLEQEIKELCYKLCLPYYNNVNYGMQFILQYVIMNLSCFRKMINSSSFEDFANCITRIQSKMEIINEGTKNNGSSSASSASLYNLPNEMLSLICSFLVDNSRTKFSLVCKKFYSVSLFSVAEIDLALPQSSLISSTAARNQLLKYPNLTSLYINQYNICLSHLPTKIKNLTIHHQQHPPPFISIHHIEFHKITNIQSLKIINWNTTILSCDSISALVDLTSLDLVTTSILNQTCKISSQISKCTSLNQVRISAMLKALPLESLLGTSSLKTLNLSQNRLTFFPVQKYELNTTLTHLDLRNNDLQTLTNYIVCIFGLEKLFLSSNQLIDLPQTFYFLQQLTVVNLDDNLFSDIPSQILQLTKLKSLSLDNNQIQTLPIDISDLTNLTLLSMGHNRLSTESFGSEILALHNLQVLLFNGNEFYEIPEQIMLLHSLQHLDFHKNQIEIIPDSITQLQNLTLLDLSINFIVMDSLLLLSSLLSTTLTNLTTLNLELNG